MSRRNTECKVCKNMFHACGSCGLNGWENEICTDKCYQEFKQERREDLKEKFFNLFENKEICQYLYDVIEDPKDYDGYRLNIFVELLGEALKK